jgi:Cdc6-like AAA superfamily ATPase
MSTQTHEHPDPELQWLLDKTIKQDLIGIAPARIEQLISRIATFKREELPHTVGLFGGWGSGKTTFLGLLARECAKKQLPTLYFNAWRNAGDNQIVPALIYRLIRAVPVEPGGSGERVCNVLLAIRRDCREHGTQLHRWGARTVTASGTIAPDLA